jgi:hypothetical protein
VAGLWDGQGVREPCLEWKPLGLARSTAAAVPGRLAGLPPRAGSAPTRSPIGPGER